MVDASKKIKGEGNPSDGQMVSRTVSEYTSGRDTHHDPFSRNIAQLNKARFNASLSTAVATHTTERGAACQF